jgi:hypothetical protein
MILKPSRERNDTCLFAVGKVSESVDSVGLAVIVDDLLQAGKAVHTIRQHLLGGFSSTHVRGEDVTWNLPAVYWPPNNQEENNIQEWMSVLRGESPPVLTPSEEHADLSNRWDQLQLLLHFLQHGLAWFEANLLTKQFYLETPSENRHHAIYQERKRRLKIQEALDAERCK